MLPSAQRFVWHKLYSSAARRSFPDKAQKDLMQAATLAAVLVETQDEDFSDSFDEVPAGMKKLVKARWPALRRALAAHPQTCAQFVETLA